MGCLARGLSTEYRSARSPPCLPSSGPDASPSPSTWGGEWVSAHAHNPIGRPCIARCLTAVVGAFFARPRHGSIGRGRACACCMREIGSPHVVAASSAADVTLPRVREDTAPPFRGWDCIAFGQFIACARSSLATEQRRFMARQGALGSVIGRRVGPRGFPRDGSEPAPGDLGVGNERADERFAPPICCWRGHGTAASVRQTDGAGMGWCLAVQDCANDQGQGEMIRPPHSRSLLSPLPQGICSRRPTKFAHCPSSVSQ